MIDPGPTDRDSSHDDDPALSLLRTALREAPHPERSLLPKIQDRIRLRTRGRYFRTRYSRSLDPVSLLLIVCLLIVLVLTAVFLVFQPLSSDPVPHELPKAPVDPLTAPAPGQPGP